MWNTLDLDILNMFSPWVAWKIGYFNNAEGVYLEQYQDQQTYLIFSTSIYIDTQISFQRRALWCNLIKILISGFFFFFFILFCDVHQKPHMLYTLLTYDKHWTYDFPPYSRGWKYLFLLQIKATPAVTNLHLITLPTLALNFIK